MVVQNKMTVPQTTVYIWHCFTTNIHPVQFFFKPLLWPWVTSSLQTIRAPPTHRRGRTWNFRKQKQGTANKIFAKYSTILIIFLQISK